MRNRGEKEIVMKREKKKKKEGEGMKKELWMKVGGIGMMIGKLKYGIRSRMNDKKIKKCEVKKGDKSRRRD